MMTEQEAKTKWCPLARSPGTVTEYKDGYVERTTIVVQNRGYQMGGPIPNAMCIGSACMAWRAVTKEVTALKEQEPPGPGWSAVMGNETITIWRCVGGYCGAFGPIVAEAVR